MSRDTTHTVGQSTGQLPNQTPGWRRAWPGPAVCPDGAGDPAWCEPKGTAGGLFARPAGSPPEVPATLHPGAAGAELAETRDFWGQQRGGCRWGSHRDRKVPGDRLPREGRPAPSSSAALGPSQPCCPFPPRPRGWSDPHSLPHPKLASSFPCPKGQVWECAPPERPGPAQSPLHVTIS